MFIEPTITWVPSGFSGYIWLDTKNCVKKRCAFHMKVKKGKESLIFDTPQVFDLMQVDSDAASFPS